jgi:hypothetical protein
MATPPDFTAGEVLTAAQMNKAGMWLVASASFSAVASIQLDNVFTADYDNYRLDVHVTAYGSAAANEGQVLLRAASTNSTANYSYARPGLTYAATYPTEGATGTTRWYVGRTNGSGSFGGANAFSMTFYGPALADRTWMTANAVDGSIAAAVGGVHDAATAYDGFQLSYGANITGTYRLYGLRD